MISLVDFLLWLIVLLVVGSIYWYLTIPKNLPPGPVGLPFLGSALNFSDGRKQHLILQEHVKKYGPLSKVYIVNKLVIILGNYETIYEALVKHGDVFSGRPKMEPFIPKKIRRHGLALSEGELWKEQRRFALSTLRDFGVGRPILEPRIKEEIEYLCGQINEYASAGQPFDPQYLITCTVSNLISQLLFGRRYGYDENEFARRFIEVSKKAAAFGVNFLSPTVVFSEATPILETLLSFSEETKAIGRFQKYTEAQMRQTISTFDPDTEPTNYIHAFLKTGSEIKGDSYFTDNQLLATCLDLFQAGTDSTATTIRWAVLYLCHHPEVQEKLYQQIKHEVGTSALPSYADRVKLPYAEAVVMETQRLSNLVPLGLFRRAMAPSKLMGYDIPEDAIILPLLTNILHNPEVYPEPFKFDPERFLDSNGKVIRDPKLIPFQIGKRVCLGEPLARMELFLVVVGLASRFRFYFPSGKSQPTMDPVVSFLSAPVSFEICAEIRD